MIYARARGRYLAAIGLTGLGAAFAGIGCPGSEPTTTPPLPPTTATAAATAPAATTGGQATPHTSAWVPDVDPLAERPRPGIGVCPHGPFCVPQPASAGDSPAPVPAPYAACASTMALPAGVGPVATPAGRVPSVTFDPAGTATERASDPAACCYKWSVLCVGGRALRGAEGPITAGQAERRDWLAVEGAVGVEGLAPAVRAALAAHWAREAAFEHASVASFARASLALLAVGAPPELVAATHAAAIDEIEHARLTYALASAYGGAAQGPGALDVGAGIGGAMTLVSVAVETFLDACAGESAAALALREAAAGAEDEAVGAVLARIAEDEERHAELAWRTVAWALRAGGDEVARGLGAAIARLRAEVAGAETGTAVDALARYGVLGEDAQRAIRRRALAEVVIPCGEALLAG